MLSYDDMVYTESGFLFYRDLLRFDGLMLHSSAVMLDGRAYLFSGDSGAGKSTHTRLWQRVFGDRAVVFNDDKPALRRIDGRWYAYGTPWCGKDHINQNVGRVPLCGICFLKKAKENKIVRLEGFDAVRRLLPQTIYRLRLESNLDLVLSHLEKLAAEVPIFEFFNLPIEESALLSYETMKNAAKES
ncbi:MAG: hypothetical protein E7638_07975 [Ruminococcaceae bacterium]|nr:hypothetical protein [Oscillospiraceae bacterium]